MRRPYALITCRFLRELLEEFQAPDTPTERMLDILGQVALYGQNGHAALEQVTTMYNDLIDKLKHQERRIQSLTIQNKTLKDAYESITAVH